MNTHGCATAITETVVYNGCLLKVANASVTSAADIVRHLLADTDAQLVYRLVISYAADNER